MSLKTYRRKRDFLRTPEPSGKEKGKRKPSTFVIQKHNARRLHYDFRLEMGGVLKSWAVPKGPPSKRGERRLAVHVEDHPLSYADFEGIIPAGNYGAGTVMVWDFGTYECEASDPEAALKKGKLDLNLHGRKLKGSWTLVRLRGRGEEEKEPWLLIKRAQDTRPVSARQDDRSARTGRSMKQIAEDKDRLWRSNRAARGRRSSPDSESEEPETFSADFLRDLPPKKAAFIPPMLARLVPKIPPGNWKMEIKFDGIRGIAVKNKKQIRLFSRNRLELDKRFPKIIRALSDLDCSSAVLDGEVAALDKKGRSSFQLLQAASSSARPPPIFYYLFDLLQLNGKDLKNLPLESRRDLLQALAKKCGDPIRFSATITGEIPLLLKQAKKLGLEGFIGKKAASRYDPGRRSGAWLKIKTFHQQEFVIGGFTPGKGSRAYFGALLVGYYQKRKLLYASKVGTGFDVRVLADLHKKMKKLSLSECPFANLPQPGPLGIPPPEMKVIHWVRPRLVAELRFSEWTRDGHLRHPVFLGLREDKEPEKVIREEPP